MLKTISLTASAAAALLFIGCASIPPGAERGPNGTMAYDVLIEASTPGAKVEVNGEVIGNTPVHLKVFGDPDGTFHDFGSSAYEIRALPLATNQFAQTRIFQTGHLLGPEDRVPRRVYFDMNQQEPTYAPGAYPPPAYYGPPAYYYGPGPYYYGPSFRFNVGPGYHHGYGGYRRHW
jgi:hypothetical protein